MQTYEITSEMKGTGQFLVVRHENEEYLNDYLLKILENNSIMGILPVKSQAMNGKTILNYPIGDKFNLFHLVKQNRIGTNEARILYIRMTETINEMGEYFLNSDQCVYDLNYLYVDSTWNPYFLYLPFENIRNQEIYKVWKDFFLNLLSWLSDGKQEEFYDKLMRYLIQPNFKMEEFYDFLKEKQQETETRISPVVEQFQKNIGFENRYKTAKQESAATKEIREKSIAIPGFGQSYSIEESEKKEKKKKVSFFGFSKKKEKVQKEKIEKLEKLEKEKMQKETEKKVIENKSAEKKSTEQEKENAVQASLSSQEWSKTMLLTTEKENCTKMLNTEQPHLLCGENYILMEQFPFTIGKSGTDYIVANPTVSRLHATIIKQNQEYYIQDEGSRNSTYVNGKKILAGVPVKLMTGDRLRLSNEEFVFYKE